MPRVHLSKLPNWTPLCFQDVRYKLCQISLQYIPKNSQSTVHPKNALHLFSIKSVLKSNERMSVYMLSNVSVHVVKCQCTCCQMSVYMLSNVSVHVIICQCTCCQMQTCTTKFFFQLLFRRTKSDHFYCKIMLCIAA